MAEEKMKNKYEIYLYKCIRQHKISNNDISDKDGRQNLIFNHFGERYIYF